MTKPAASVTDDTMPIVVINLERAANRRKSIVAQFADSNIPFEFLTAVDGSRGDHPLMSHYDPSQSIWYYGKPLTPGAVGCFGSHYLAWQRCVEVGKPIIVMEDDVAALPHFRRTIGILKPLMAEYPLIRLFGLNERPFRQVRSVDGMTLIRFLRGPAGLQSYAISPRGAETLLAGAECWREPVDRYVDRFWSHGLPSLALRPYPFFWGDDTSSSTRIWESKSTLITFVGKTRRFFDHFGRHYYNLRQELKALAPKNGA